MSDLSRTTRIDDEIIFNEENPVYDYLVDNYDIVEIRDDRYYFENSTEYGFIPIKYSPGNAINVYAYMPGDGGGKSKDTIDYVATHGDEYQDCAVFVAKSHKTQHDGADVVSSATNFATSNDMTIANLGGEAFSGSGGRMADALAEFVSDPNNADTNVKLLWTDAYTNTSTSGEAYKANPESYKTLGEHEVDMYFFSSDNSPAKTSLDMVRRSGEPIIYIRANAYSHGGKQDESTENGLMLYIMGLNDELTTPDGEDPNYDIRQYNPETKTFDIELTEEDIHSDIGLEFKMPKVIKVSDLFVDDGIKITETMSETSAKYQGLKDMEASISIRLNPSIDPTIASNMTYVANTMTNIRSRISSSNFLKAQTMGFRSSNGIPGCISVYLDKYYDFVGQLMDSLAKQTEAVVSVGQAIVDMDIDLQKKGEEELGGIEEVEELPTIVEEPVSPSEEENTSLSEDEL